MTLKSVVDLLNKQKIIEGMVRTQPMQRHELVEKVVHKKHLAELQTVLASLSVSEIGKILAELPLDDARLLWQQIEADRLNDILWEVSSSLGADLAGDTEPHFHAGEVTAYELVDGRMRISRHQAHYACRSKGRGGCHLWNGGVFGEERL